MVNQVEPSLTQRLYDYLQQERFVLLSTVDFETEGPNVSALSWVLAKDKQTIVFAVDNRSRIIHNINKNNKIAINVIVEESSYSISGNASMQQERINGIPLPIALIQLNIKEVRDVMFYGSKITTQPEYDKTYDLEAAARLDRQVMDAMKKA
jgi:hypothetical protein